VAVEQGTRARLASYGCSAASSTVSRGFERAEYYGCDVGVTGRRLVLVTVASAALVPLALAPEASPLSAPTLASPIARSLPDRVGQLSQDRSQALGFPWAGRLVDGVRLGRSGYFFFTWDFVKDRSPNRAWRRYGSDRVIRVLQRVLAGYMAANPGAPRVGIGDLSRPHGGDFGSRFGAPGHASHQNGLDVDVYYPRLDGRERPPLRQRQIDGGLAQDLVDRFVAAGADKVFVGPRTGLRGPPAIVQVLAAYHDNHMHVRLAGDGTRPMLLGRSTRGRPIRAFARGSGRPHIIVVGCIHGDECAGSVIASRLLHSGPPARGTLWLVPDLNPDGHAVRRRLNARGVDLNRNFPGSWRPLPTSGIAAGSEVETRVAMRLIRRLRPLVTIWFHQPQALVRATGRSVGIARRYARLAGMRFKRLARPPGSATEWQHRYLPRTRAFVVELPPGPLSIRDAGRYATATRRLLERVSRGHRP
jgi:Penicillin-insensitive murein endopeptidase/Zinc carboxypeptidase